MRPLRRVPFPAAVHGFAAGETHAGARVAEGLAQSPRVVLCAGAIGGLLVPPAAAAWTLGRTILIRAPAWDPASPSTHLLLAHECVHVAQWHEEGRIRFLVRYVAGYLRGRLRGLDHDAAYRAIPAEEEAFGVQRDLACVAHPW